uniref:Kelch repeat-containing protein n=2 Tax=Tetraselmis sp. GSL018 TaxID=582737 RepID=A0A061RT73_9CHLO
MADAELDAFVMRAWFWDSNAHQAAHYVSPDYENCGRTAGNETLLPDGGPLDARSTAVGAYTLSHQLKYCVSSPWQSSGLVDLRSAEWHRLEVFSTPKNGLQVSIDGQVIKEADPIVYDRVLISTGYSADGVGHDFLRNAHAYFDEISVRPLTMCGAVPCATAEASAAEHPIAKHVRPIQWRRVELSDRLAPPARYGHTLLYYEGGILLFGGERSSYSFNDVWWFSFRYVRWYYLAPENDIAPMRRFDHAAVIDGRRMYVSGGRTDTNMVLDDMWMLDIPTQQWFSLGAPNGIGKRFGHAAAMGASGHMYIYGGFVDQSNAGFSNSFLRCNVTDGEGGTAMDCEDITDGCPEREIPPAAWASGVGLSARSGHSLLTFGRRLLAFGGSDEVSVELRGAYVFDEAKCEWARLSLSQSDALGTEQFIEDISRHDHGATPMRGWMVAQGGVEGSTFVDTVYVLGGGA